jgi:hypothetical protein
MIRRSRISTGPLLLLLLITVLIVIVSLSGHIPYLLPAHAMP